MLNFSASSFPAASSASLFGSASSSSLFGAASSASLFGAPSSASLFPVASTPSLFGAPSAPFSLNKPATSFPAPAWQGAQVPGQQPQQQVAGLLTKDGRPAVYSTKWSDLHPNTQTELLNREAVYREVRERSRVIDANERIQKGSKLQQGLHADASTLSTTLRGLAAQLEGDKSELDILRQDVKGMIADAEVAVATYGRAKLRQERPEYALLPPLLPDHFLQKTIERLEAARRQYEAVTSQLESVLATGDSRHGSGSGLSSQAQAIQSTVTNIHQLLIQTAAKVEGVHARLEEAKDTHLKSRQQVGDSSDPFEEAARKAEAAQKAATKTAPKVPPPNLTPAPAASAAAPATPGLFTPATPGLALPAASAASSASLLGGFGSAFGAPQSAPGFSAFGAASSAAPAAFGVASAPSLFGASAAAPAQTGFGLTAAAPLSAAPLGGFGASSASLFGAPAASAGMFGAAPAFGAGGLFGGANTAPSFGAPAAAAAPNTKSRKQRSTGSKSRS